jgi:hypothetical protein
LVSSKKPVNSAALARQKADTGRLRIEQEFKDFHENPCFCHRIQHPAFKILTSTYPGLTQEMLDYEIQVIRDFVRFKNPAD